MKTPHDLSFDTKCIHAGHKPEPVTGAIMMPIFQTSTYAQASPACHKGYEYSRTHNPTRKALEENLAALESAQYGFCFSSGCAAATVILLSLKAGDHVIALDDLYGGTRRLFEKVFQRFNLEFTFLDLKNPDDLRPAIKKNTRMLWLETPSNPLLKLVDLKALSDIAHEASVMVAVDNTFATPALQNPLLFGADLVVHSTTKYIGGHSDVVGGAILTNDKDLAETIAFLSNSVGGIPSPLDCFLVLRGIKTLHLRMQRHSDNASFIAQKLASHQKVSSVYFPGLKNHPNHSLLKTQMRGPSGMVSFVVTGGEAQARGICEKTRLFTCAESLGGVESLIEHPASMTHASVAKDQRKLIGIDDGLVRLSVGIEDREDLWSDLEQALK